MGKNLSWAIFFLQNHPSTSNDFFWIFVIREQLLFKKKKKVFKKKMWGKNKWNTKIIEKRNLITNLRDKPEKRFTKLREKQNLDQLKVNKSWKSKWNKLRIQIVYLIYKVYPQVLIGGAAQWASFLYVLI
jgi:hypothetical protein